MAFDAVTTTKNKPPEKKARLSPAQQAAVDAYGNATQARAAVPYISLAPDKDGASALDFEGMDRETGAMLLSQALGLNDPGLLSSFVGQIVTSLKVAEGGETLLNFAIQAIAAMEPKDPAEAMLCMQMAVVQVMFSIHSKSLMTGTVPLHVAESKERSFNRLARTFAAQMQTLKVYRAKGKQQIVVKHVIVNDGGQAIVGNVATRGQGGRQAENGR